MFSNYLASAFRNLLHNRVYSAIGIVGLAAGFAAAILVSLYVRDEFSYDSFWPDHERTFRISTWFPDQPMAEATPRLGPLLKATFPEVESFGRLVSQKAEFKHGQISDQENVWWTDAEFFDVLKLPALAGDPRAALQRPDAVVVTREIARKYFGEDAPLGSMVEVDGHPLRLAAVLQDLPPNTHLDAKIFIAGQAPYSPLAAATLDRPENRNNVSAATYLRLSSPAAAQVIRRAFPDLLQRLGLPAQLISLHLTQVADIHFAPAGPDAMKPPGDPATSYAAAAIGGLILLTACINFVNLLTARAARRATEIGVRKTAGARRRDLGVQFMGESLLHAVIAGLIAVALVELLLPAFNALMARNISFAYWHDLSMLSAVIALIVCVGLLAGFYPAFVLAAFNPIAALKGTSAPSAASQRVRRTLVIVQFSVLIGLLFATIVVSRQLAFAVRERVRGDADAILLVQGACRSSFEDSVRTLRGVREVTCSRRLPVSTDSMAMSATADGDGHVKRIEMSFGVVDFDFFSFYGLTARAGRLFSKQHGGDLTETRSDQSGRQAIVVNETAARTLGFSSPQQAIGKSPQLPQRGQPVEIVGVVEDFPVGSVQKAVPAISFYVAPAEFETLHVKLARDTIPQAVEEIEQTWKRINGMKSFRVRFLSRAVEEDYANLQRETHMAGALAAVALFIGCLGLFGLSAFNAERRTKEIGVRKAMGASKTDVMRLLVWQFMKPVLWANLIAWPVGAWLMQRWLNGFAYHIDLSPWIFVAASATALAIALITVAGHCWFAAKAHPVNALRDE